MNEPTNIHLSRFASLLALPAVAVALLLAGGCDGEAETAPPPAVDSHDDHEGHEDHDEADHEDHEDHDHDEHGAVGPTFPAALALARSTR